MSMVFVFLCSECGNRNLYATGRKISAMWLYGKKWEIKSIIACFSWIII